MPWVRSEGVLVTDMTRTVIVDKFTVLSGAEGPNGVFTVKNGQVVLTDTFWKLDQSRRMMALRIAEQFRNKAASADSSAHL